MLPRIERLNGGKPIVARIPAHPWEGKVTFNPACILVEDRAELGRIVPALPFDSPTRERLGGEDALVFLYYRAQGAKSPSADYTRSSLGLAVLDPELNLLARHDAPVVLPDEPYDDLGVEDARLSRIGDLYVLCYTAYGSGPAEAGGNRIRIALAVSGDLVHWEKRGLLKGAFNKVQNKNAMLFDQKAGGKWLMLHRPMEGEDAMAVHLAESDDIFGTWKSRGVLMKPIPNPAFIDTWAGGGAPPLHLGGERWLILYHVGNRKRDRTREYDLGIAIADFSRKEIIVRRDEPLMRPETEAETSGDADLGVNNVLFVCGAYFYKGDLYFPYAGADSVVLGGKVTARELARYTG